MRVSLIYRRMEHHASRSGYDQLARHLTDRLTVRRLEGHLPKIVPRRIWKRLVQASGVEWYNEDSLGLEVAAALRILLSKGEIIHFLYGEDGYRYLGRLKGVTGWTRAKIVCTYHQPPAIFNRVVAPRSILTKLDAVIALASQQAAHLASLVGSEKVFCIPHGVDTDFYGPAERKQSEERLCLSVGLWQRDFKMLRAVAERIAVRDARVRFKVITSEENAGLFDGLKNVETLSWVSDAELLDAYRKADLLVLPLFDCTANNSLLEGLACGLPVVTTDVGGIRDYVNSACAVLVPSGNVESMCEAVLRLAADDALRLRMGRESRRRALRYDWRKVADQVTDVYRSIAG